MDRSWTTQKMDPWQNSASKVSNPEASLSTRTSRKNPGPQPTPPAVSARGHLVPLLPPRNSSPRREDINSDEGRRRDPSLLGAGVILCAGPYKGYVGTVRDATQASARVELYSPSQTILVKRTHLRVLDPPSRNAQQWHPRTSSTAAFPARTAPYPLDRSNGTTRRIATPPRSSPSSGMSPASIPLEYRTPLWGLPDTPMYDSGTVSPRSPASNCTWKATSTPESRDYH